MRDLFSVAIKGLMFDEKGSFLLCKEENGYWDLPGGGMDYGENYDENINREIKEEMGLELDFLDKTPNYFLTFKSPTSGIWKSNIIYKINIKDIDNFVASDECVEIGFFTKKEAEKLKIWPNIEKLLKQM